MTVASLGDSRPPANIRWPAATNLSLNASMAAISSGLCGGRVWVSMTEITNFMTILSYS